MEGFTSLSSCTALLSLRGLGGTAGGGDVARFPAFVTGSVFKFAFHRIVIGSTTAIAYPACGFLWAATLDLFYHGICRFKRFSVFVSGFHASCNF